MADKNLTNIQIYQKKTKYNIGVILFGIIFIYLVITILAYVTNKKVSVYEVREGSILKDNAYTGLVLRDEQIVKADSDGYVNYFVTEGSKVGSKTNVYSISQNKLGLDDQDASTSAENDSASSDLTAEEQASIIQKAHSFTESFRSQQYNDVYNFKNTITDVVLTNTAQSRQARLQALVDAGTSGLTVHTADSDGVVVYTIDGYESLTKDDVTTDILEKKNYESTTLSNDTLVNSGDPVYKLIMSDDWTVVIELSDTMAQQLAEQSSVKVKFSKDNETTWAALQIYNTKDSNLAYLTFDHSMIRYATERYLDIELILEDESGLKIPKIAGVAPQIGGVSRVVVFACQHRSGYSSTAAQIQHHRSFGNGAVSNAFIGDGKHFFAHFQRIGAHDFGLDKGFGKAVRFWELHGCFLFCKDSID